MRSNGWILATSIITQVIIEILALSLAKNGVIIAGGQIFKIVASCFVNVSKEESLIGRMWFSVKAKGLLSGHDSLN